MPEDLIIAHLKQLTEDGDKVLTTVHDLGDAEVKMSEKNDLSLISVSGTYSAEVKREVERIARKCQGSIGLEFREVSEPDGPKRPLAFDSSVLRLLKNIQEQCTRNRSSFFICTPPPKLVDMLRLSGVYENYRIVDGTGGVTGPRQTPERGTRKSHRTKRWNPTDERERQDSKRIFQLNQSLKRTASLEKGLDSAAKCVKRFLPQEPPAAPGYGFAFAYRSSEKVGGDFFDFIPLDDKTLGISIGDVSGHGIDAALIMGISKKLINIRGRDPRFHSPSEVLKQVNVDVTPDLNRRTFVTALYGILKAETGEFCFARAGHEPPILFYPGVTQTSVMSNGIALGLGVNRYFDSQIEDTSVSLEPGWCLLLSTDGIAECRNQKEAIYSRERLMFELGQIGSQRSTQGILDYILGTLETFAGGRSQEDDMTAILIQRLPDNAAEERAAESRDPARAPRSV